MIPAGLRMLLHRLTAGAPPTVWYSPLYRPPVVGLGQSIGWDARRADRVLWYLTEEGLLPKSRIRRPEPLPWSDLLRVHAEETAARLVDAEFLAQSLRVDPKTVPVDQVAAAFRTACGGTLGAAREVLEAGGHAVNLLGGFQRAAPGPESPCAWLNDIAIAVGALRAGGWDGRALVIDLDAHAPTGTAAFVDILGGPERFFVVSLNQAGEPTLDGTTAITLPPDAGDVEVLGSLDELLSRLPKADLAFVVAGGDVLDADRRGRLRMSLDGVRQRDIRAADALCTVPTVWLPGGGYHRDAWRLLAGTVLAVLGRGGPVSDQPIPATDPIYAHFKRIAHDLTPAALSGGDTAFVDEGDLAEALGMPTREKHRLLGFYTPAGLELGLARYGILDTIRRLGYGDLQIELSASPEGDLMRLFGRAEGARHVLVESVMAKRKVDEQDALFINWLLMQNPRAAFSKSRPKLPGQDAPGLGLAREVWLVFGLAARRLGLVGVAMRPAWLHIAYSGRRVLRFVDPARQGRFEALIRDLAAVPLVNSTHAVAEGRVLLNGAPYSWEPTDMAVWLDQPVDPIDAATTAAVREASSFQIVPKPSEPPRNEHVARDPPPKRPHGRA